MIEFLEKNLLYIIILSILIFASLVFFSIYNDKFTDVPPYLSNKGNTRKVQVEAFESFNLDKRQNHFCKNKSFSKIDKHCNKLNDVQCKNKECCILLNGDIVKDGKDHKYNKCVAGDQDGPHFHSKTENDKRYHIRANYWYYKDKCIDGKKSCPN
tara:strand:+ start:5123 stop:5587 length:465 start_codon:yes stop_codon:yes gene_type:complete